MHYNPKSFWQKWQLYSFTFHEVITEYIASPLTTIINSFIKVCDFPDKWKQARITPIPKVDSSQDNNDFRPISILPVLSKIYERLVHNQVVEFLENHHLLEDNNSGFGKGHSTTSVLLSIRDDILKAIKNRSECTLLVLAQWLERPTGISGRSWVRLPLGNSENLFSE